MALTIDSSSFNTAPETKCNLLPCTISKDGDANVTRYFETSVRRENGGELIFFFLVTMYAVFHFQLSY